MADTGAIGVQYAASNRNVVVSEHPATFTIDTETIPWTNLDAHNAFKLLHVDHGSGRMTMMFKMTPGCRFGVHKHYAPVEFFVLKGGFGYEAGIARKWGYGVEGAPSVHEPICEDGEEMVMLAFSHGGYQMFNEDGSLGKVFDATDFMALARANNALAAVERAASVHPLAWLDRQSTRTGKLGG